MKTARIIALALLVALVALACAGCGASKPKGHAANEKFTLSKNTYALEKWVRQSDKDASGKAAYGLCLLLVGDDAPVTFVLGSNEMHSGVDVAALLGEEEIGTQNINFAAASDAPGFGVRATFTFLIPEGAELPQSATLFDTTDKQKSAALNLVGLTVEE